MFNSAYFWMLSANVAWVGLMVEQRWTYSLVFWFLWCMGLSFYTLFIKTKK